MTSIQDSFGKTSSSSWSKSTTGGECYKSHPGLKVTTPDGQEVTLYGGRASSPIVKDADIYVSLASYSSPDFATRYPWEEGPRPIIFTFEITDMCAPNNKGDFRKMVAWLKTQALAGKKIHVGCLGGHGRTGMLLAALVKEIGGIEDAITYVRENYCKKAVESTEQVKFLAKEYGIKEVAGSKSWGGSSTSKKNRRDLGFDEFDTGLGGARGGGYGSLAKGSVMPEGWPSIKAMRHNARFKHASEDSVLEVMPKALAGNVWGVVEW